MTVCCSSLTPYSIALPWLCHGRLTDAIDAGCYLIFDFDIRDLSEKLSNPSCLFNRGK